MRLPPSKNDFTRTDPGGNWKSPSGPWVICVPSGIESQRSFAAPSDQKGAAGAYGTRPGAGAVASPGAVQPVCERRGAGPPAPTPEGGATISYTPPLRSVTY